VSRQEKLASSKDEFEEVTFQKVKERHEEDISLESSSQDSMKAKVDDKSPLKRQNNLFQEIKALSKALTKGHIYFAKTVKHGKGKKIVESSGSNSIITSEFESGDDVTSKKMKESDFNDSFTKAGKRAKETAKKSESHQEDSVKLPHEQAVNNIDSGVVKLLVEEMEMVKYALI